MPFDAENRRRIRKESGYYCQVCGAWHPPGGKEMLLDAHSVDRTHKDHGLAVCRSNYAGECHSKLHQVADDPDKLRKISIDAVALNNLSAAVSMVDAGVPEKRIRRVLNRLGNF